MKKLNMSIIKKRIVTFGLAAMMVVGMSMPAYARSVTDPGAVGWQYNAEEADGLYSYYIEPSSWLGSYDVAINGYEYQLTISLVPDGKEYPRWLVRASRVPDGKGYEDAYWSGWFYSDPRYGSSINENGYPSSVVNWNGDKDHPDMKLTIAWDPDTDQIYLQALALQSFENGQKYLPEAGTVPGGEAVVPPVPEDPNAPVVVYKKVSNAYTLLVPRTDATGTSWMESGWTTDGTNQVPEPWWTPEANSAGSGVG